MWLILVTCGDSLTDELVETAAKAGEFLYSAGQTNLDAAPCNSTEDKMAAPRQIHEIGRVNEYVFRWSHNELAWSVPWVHARKLNTRSTEDVRLCYNLEAKDELVPGRCTKRTKTCCAPVVTRSITINTQTD